MFREAIKRVITKRIIVYTLTIVYSIAAWLCYPDGDYSWLKESSIDPLLFLLSKLIPIKSE
jgi:hypothetical protein